MKILNKFALAGLLAATLSSTTFAADEYIVRMKSGSPGMLANRLGAEVKDISNGHGVFLVRGARLGVVQVLRAHPDVVSLQVNTSVALPESVASANIKYNLTPDPAHNAKLGVDLTKVPGTPPVTYSGQTGVALPSKYLYMAQPGIVKIKVPADLMSSLPNVYGNGVRVALIDTWVDASVTTLAASIDTSNKAGAYDCITNQSGGASIKQETSPFIDQETSPFIDSTGTMMINQETSPFIDQETSPFIDQETSPFIDGIAFGHGTMVAGLIHRIAPGAMLIPIRAFQNDGSGTIADVIRGIYYAVDTAKADMINMSFSSPSDSAELRTAIAYAQSKGVICVASVSNSNSSKPVYPAAEKNVIGIAATDYNDYKASFSDYGDDVELAAPGTYITSTYPRDSSGRDHWATGSGTSFSTPLVTGTVALLKTLNWSGVTVKGAEDYLGKAADPILDPAYRKQLGDGRLDVSGSMSAAGGRDR